MAAAARALSEATVAEKRALVARRKTGARGRRDARAGAAEPEAARCDAASPEDAPCFGAASPLAASHGGSRHRGDGATGGEKKGFTQRGGRALPACALASATWPHLWSSVCVLESFKLRPAGEGGAGRDGQRPRVERRHGRPQRVEAIWASSDDSIGGAKKIPRARDRTARVAVERTWRWALRGTGMRAGKRAGSKTHGGDL